MFSPEEKDGSKLNYISPFNRQTEFWHALLVRHGKGKLKQNLGKERGWAELKLQ